MSKQVTVLSLRGFPMKASANLVEAKNWIYINFEKGRLCFDKNTLEIQKGQSYRIPEVSRDELKKVADLF
jgi:hypothetical protein